MREIIKNRKIISEHSVDLKKSQFYRLKDKVLRSYDQDYEDSFQYISLYNEPISSENKESAVVNI
jgi:hypothetical protein